MPVTIYKYPAKSKWLKLLERPTFETSSLEASVTNILNEVKLNGDDALKRYSSMFDKVTVEELAVSEEEVAEAIQNVDEELKGAIEKAKLNIEKFHCGQLIKEEPIIIEDGISCWRKSVAIEKVGLYIPGGSAPLFSTVLMLGIPARLAGCTEVVLCTPPGKNGKIHPAILYTAQVVGISKIYKTGGAQAIAALAYGTATIPKVFKIFGPGNQYVTSAKQLVQKDGVAIDMPAGPSEVAVLADETAVASFVAADLLSQAEHGADSQAILVTTSERIMLEVEEEITKQLQKLSRKEITNEALKNSKIILLETLNDCVEMINAYSPEHLIIACKNEEDIAERIINAGSVFLGNYSPESVGDYASGTNHTLPTNGYAKAYSGVSVDSFVKKITFQKLTKEGLKKISKTVEVMAEAEGLLAHRNAVRFRLEEIGDRR